MVNPIAGGPEVIVCNTCRHSADERMDRAGENGGERLVRALKAVQAADPRYSHIAVHELSCLFACTEFCAVHLRASGKFSHALGGFKPNKSSARAILDYMLAYDASTDGLVSPEDCPEGVKGHFITRFPPSAFSASP